MAKMKPEDYGSIDKAFPEDPTGLREVNTRFGYPMKVGDLQRHVQEHHEGAQDQENWTVTFSEEFCMLDCDGEAHRTGKPDPVEGNFCRKHVHRSAHGEVRNFPDLVSDVQGF